MSFGGRIKIRETKPIPIVPVDIMRRIERLEARVAELEAKWSAS